MAQPKSTATAGELRVLANIPLLLLVVGAYNVLAGFTVTITGARRDLGMVR